ncbi:TolC family protein [Candidatus Magnetomonas plexicatena]|uniref:TolC family protein n=1 Tax=Candidatus Magnetomonas plexicatena TaxID=2552947 RepID=UPI001C787169|nr:TolC family protein [Nitrospirales bacterium LBB_01]
MLTKLTPVEDFWAAKNIWERTGFPLVGGNDKEGSDFTGESLLGEVTLFSFFVIPAKAGIQFLIKGVNYKVIFCFLFLISLVLPAHRLFALEQMELTVEDAAAMVLNKNLSLKTESYKPGAAASDVLIYQGEFDPTVSIGIASSYTKEPSSTSYDSSQSSTSSYTSYLSGKLLTGTQYELSFENYRYWGNSSYLTFNPYYTSEVKLSITQPVLKGFGTSVQSTNINVYKNAFEIAKLTYDSTVVEKIAEAAKKYWDLASAMSNVEAANIGLKLANDTKKIVTAKIDVGLSAPVDIYTAEAEIARREGNLLDAEKALTDTENALKTLLNINGKDVQLKPVSAPVKPVVPPHLDALVETALKHKQDYLSAKLEKQNRELLKKYYKNQMLPEIDLTGSYGYIGLNENHGTALDKMKTGSDFAWQIGLTVSLPIGNRKYKGYYNKASYEKDQYEAKILELEQTTQSSLRDALNALIFAEKKIKTTEKTRLAAEKQLEAEEGRFKAGLATLNDVLKFQSDYVTAIYQEKMAKNEYSKALIEIKRLQGITPV